MGWHVALVALVVGTLQPLASPATVRLEAFATDPPRATMQALHTAVLLDQLALASRLRSRLHHANDPAAHALVAALHRDTLLDLQHAAEGLGAATLGRGGCPECQNVCGCLAGHQLQYLEFGGFLQVGFAVMVCSLSLACVVVLCMTLCPTTAPEPPIAEEVLESWHKLRDVVELEELESEMGAVRGGKRARRKR